jgi:hypothetical protein
MPYQVDTLLQSLLLAFPHEQVSNERYFISLIPLLELGANTDFGK